MISSRYSSIGGFLEFNFNPDEKWNFILGSRIDKDQRYHLTLNPRVGAVFTSSKIVAKALFGTAFLAPSPQNIYDRFGSFSTNDGGLTYASDFFQLPNPELEPQTIATWELGTRYFITKNFTIDIKAYFSKTENLISPITSDISPAIINGLYPNSTYQIDGFNIPIDQIQVNGNLGKSSIYGGSAALQYQFQTQSVRGNIFSSFSFVDGSTDIDEEGSIVERNLPGVAPVMIKMGGTVTTQKVSFHLRAQFISKQRTFSVSAVNDSNGNGNLFDDNEYKEISGYYALNANILYTVSSAMKLSLGVRNLLDRRYKNVNTGAGVVQGASSGSAEFNDGAPQNPIRVTTGLSFQF